MPSAKGARRVARGSGVSKKGQKNKSRKPKHTTWKQENMGTTITIKLKGQSIIYFSSSSTILWFLAFY